MHAKSYVCAQREIDGADLSLVRSVKPACLYARPEVTARQDNDNQADATRARRVFK